MTLRERALEAAADFYSCRDIVTGDEVSYLAACLLRFAAEMHEHCPHGCMKPCPTHRRQDELRQAAEELK